MVQKLKSSSSEVGLLLCLTFAVLLVLNHMSHADEHVMEISVEDLLKGCFDDDPDKLNFCDLNGCVDQANFYVSQCSIDAKYDQNFDELNAVALRKIISDLKDDLLSNSSRVRELASINFDLFQFLNQRTRELSILNADKERNYENTATILEIASQATGVTNDLIAATEMIKPFFVSLPKRKRQEIQLLLKARGLYASDIDGIWGGQTALGLSMYLVPEFSATKARNPQELFSELSKGFMVENLWELENYNEQLKEILGSHFGSTTSSEVGTLKDSFGRAFDKNTEPQLKPFVKNMYVNGTLKTCIKVGNTWNCD